MKGRNPDIAMAMVDKDIELRAFQKPDGTFDVKATTRPSSSITGSELAEELANHPEKTVQRLVETLFDTKLPDVTPKDEGPEVPATDSAAPPPAPAGPAPAETEGGVVIEAAGKLLTLTPLEAKKYGVIEYIAKDMDDLLWQLGYTNTAVVTITPTWSEDLYKWLISPQITLLLLVLGVGGLYLEFKTPGFGLPGIVGICALAIYFGSRSVVGLADWLDIALVITE